MKRVFLLSSSILWTLAFCAYQVSAQQGWIRQSSGTTNALRALSFTDSNTGTAVGDSGTILRTTNGGTSWTSQTSGTSYTLRGVSFTDASRGTAVGDGGTILRTTSGGTIWTRDSSGVTGSLRGVSFTDANTGTVVGGDDVPFIHPIMLHTTNGGTTWTIQLTGLCDHLNAVFFTNADTGTAVGETIGIGQILRTTNGGVTWTWPNFGGHFAPLYGVSVTDANHGTAVGGGGSPGTGGMVLHTADGWATATYTNLPGGTLYGVSFVNVDTGTAVGDTGRIIRTTDGGGIWQSQLSGTRQRLNAVWFADANTGIAVGDSGTILRTTDGGVTGAEEGQNGKSQVPMHFALDQNYPNPFNPTTKIRFSLPSQETDIAKGRVREGSHVTLKVYDVLGREVTTLANEEMKPGSYERTFDGGELASGVYFYRMQSGNFVQMRKLLLLK